MTADEIKAIRQLAYKGYVNAMEISAGPCAIQQFRSELLFWDNAKPDPIEPVMGVDPGFNLGEKK